MKLTEGQQKVMRAKGHLLVVGGPGSGKTTASILKAAQIAEKELNPGQKVLFLSFARATVSRIIEAIEHEQEVPVAQKRLIDVETYHSFFWRILKTHGYLIGLPRRLSILAPQREAIALSEIRSNFPKKGITKEQQVAKITAERDERIRLAIENGHVCFDLFAPYVSDILRGSERIRRLIATMYPTIILDEFQDTNGDQWQVVQELGKCSRLIALADPEQRIYDVFGADPARLGHFQEEFNPDVVDLGADNHRSAGTDIMVFGDDILTGKFRKEKYNGIEVDFFAPFPVPAMKKLVTTIYRARERLINGGDPDWSLAVLVPTKRFTRLVSDTLRQPPSGMAEVPHYAVIDMHGTVLAAEIIALLLQPRTGNHFERFIDLVCNFYQGKGGDQPSQAALNKAMRIRKAYEDFLARQEIGKPIRVNSILAKIKMVYEDVCNVDFTGAPDKDWSTVREILETGNCKCLQEVAKEVRNLRILDRGTWLRQKLSRDWRENGCYSSALEIVRQAFVEEHFSTTARPESGVIVMNMHKAKGKQFDEVIVFEGWPKFKGRQIVANPDRIVRENSPKNAGDQARHNFRVSVTRSKRQTTILTPMNDPCILLPIKRC